MDRAVAVALVVGAAVSVCFAATDTPPLPPLAGSVTIVVGGFSAALLVVMGLAAVLHVTHAWDDLWRVHVVMSLLQALSGVAVCASSRPVFRRAYVVVGSVSWYGVVHSFVATAERIQAHHYLRPGLFLAFTAYAGALLTCPLVGPVPSLSSPSAVAGSVAGLLCLLAYFWAVELPLVRTQHAHFHGSAMHRLPPRLAGLGLAGSDGGDDGADDGAVFARHRVAYSAVLCLCHAASLALMRAAGLPPPDVSDGKKDDGEGDNDGDNDDGGRAAASAVVQARLRQRRGQPRGPGASAPPDRLPDDCVEISLDDAVLLTGGGGGS